MANKSVFKNRGILQRTPKPNTVNKAGGQAYSLSNEEALAQFAVTGTFNSTYYVGAGEQLSQVEKLASKCSSNFLAKLAVYSRQEARMKDMPAYLLAVLAARNEHALLKKVFHKVCNNSKMLLAFIRIVRSGATGRCSFGTSIKKLIQEWFSHRTPKKLYLASVGHANPSLADAIKMVHPRPVDQLQSNMFAYLLDKEYDFEQLPEDIQLFELLKAGSGEACDIPDVPFRVLTNCHLTKNQWKDIARNMPWNTLRQSLILLSRRGVFEDEKLVSELAAKLSDPDSVVKFNAFPFELLATYKACEQNGYIPTAITNAIQLAMEVATRNVPILNGNTFVAVDVSGSMTCSHVTGSSNKPSIVSTVECAALIACSILRQNKNTKIIGFDMANTWRGNDSGLYDMSYLNPHDSVMTNVSRMRFPGGGTDVSIPFIFLNRSNTKYDNVILLSDMESWSGYGGCAGGCQEWFKYKARVKNAKLACVDLQPSKTTQVPTHKDVVNIGGWNDAMFRVLDTFFNTNNKEVSFRSVVESTDI